MKRFVGCFFGSFNPIHNGHIKVLMNCFSKLDLDEMWVIVSPSNPLKSKCLIDENHRLEMVKLGTINIPNVVVSNLEFSLSKPNYSINSLSKLVSMFPDTRFALIIGQDNLVDFHLWKDYTQILDLVEVYAHSRKIAPVDSTSEVSKKIRLLEFPAIPISSTKIRALLSENLSVKDLVPSSVNNYIESHNLYR